MNINKALRQHRTVAKFAKTWYNIDMNKQLTLASMSDELGAARTSKKEFLEKIERIIPWKIFVEEIRPHYYKGECGNKPYDIELMLRISVEL